MLDALCASRDRALDGCGRVGMHGNIGPPVVRRLDRRAKLWLREGGDIKRTVRRRHAAAAGQLDLRCAQHQLLARTNAHFIWTIGNDACTKLLHPRQRIADLARQIERLAEIAVATGNRDDSAARIDAGPDDDPFVNRSFKSERGPAQIANRRETAHQRVRGLSTGDQSWYIQNHQPSRTAGVGRTSIACQCMSIRPGISVRPPPSISMVSARRSVANRRGRDFFNLIAPHEHIRWRGKSVRLSIEHAHVLEECYSTTRNGTSARRTLRLSRPNLTAHN